MDAGEAILSGYGAATAVVHSGAQTKICRAALDADRLQNCRSRSTGWVRFSE